MVNASLRFMRSGSARTLLVGCLFLAGVGLLSLAHAADPASEPEKTDTPKATAKALVPVVKGPTTLKMTIVPPKKDANISDIQEMTRMINQKLEEGWKANKITPSFYCDDHEFIRRASLDIIGRIASQAEIVEYMKDPADQRRSRLINRLLDHADYPRHWANLWSNWLLTRAGDFGRGKYHDQMTVWLEDQFANNKPYSEIATKLISASGKNTDNGAVNFVLAHLGEPIPNGKQREEGQFEMVPLTSRITRVFLGTQVQCAQCHAHPFFASLKQEQFWGINAFLRQVTRQGAPPRMQQNMMVRPDLTLSDNESVNSEANVFFELRNGKVRMWQAEFLPQAGKDRGERLDIKKTGVARREELARMLVEHEMFPKALVNRMWGLFFGRGFVNPIDDFNDNNQPSNPELLNEVAARFKHYNYDQKKLIRWITHSNAYHLSYVANTTNDKVEHESQFSRMIMKSLSPEQLFESLTTATQVDRAMQPAEKKKLRDEWLTQLISNFGDDEGNEVTFNGTIVQALLMMNGKNINDAVFSKTGPVTLSMGKARAPGDVVRSLYLTALNRPPRAAEMKRIMAELNKPAVNRVNSSPKTVYEDLFWALLNSNEFLLNH